MSIVVALKCDGYVYMGADTQVTADYEKWNPLLESEYKIKKFPDGLLVGGVGSGRILMRLMCRKEFFVLPKGSLTKKHIVMQIVPAIFSYLEANKLLEEVDGEDKECEMNASLILAHGDRLFTVGRKFEVTERANFCGIGAGKLYGFPYLSAFDGGDPNACLLSAMSCAAKHDNTVGAPFVFIDSKNLTYTVKEG